MSNKHIKIESGEYDVNSLYKYITSEDIDTNTKRINDQLTEIMNGKYTISERIDYRVTSHEKKFDSAEYNNCKNGKVFRMEEWICKECKGKYFDAVGKIVDYQVPLKWKRKIENNEGLGKVDLLSYKGETAYLLEVKSPKSTEEPLKAILEVYTYWRQLGGPDANPFLENSCAEGANILKKGVVFFENSKVYLKLLADYQRLNAIMKDLDVQLFIAKPVDNVDYFIKDIVEAKNGFIEQAIERQQSRTNELDYMEQNCISGATCGKKTYAEVVKERIVNTVPNEYLGGTFNGKKYAHICKDQKYNFIDHCFPTYGNIQGCLNYDKIDYHRGITHLNSSQAMCINYFKKFFEKEEYEILLLDTLRDMGLNIPQDVFIKHAQFEYVPNPSENTNFDFYIVLSNERHISFEIKYTENEFGKIQKSAEYKNKYADKWKNHYQMLIENCVYCDKVSVCNDNYTCMESGTLSDSCQKKDNCTFYHFYRNYQINRNIAYAEHEDDIVVFLTPMENYNLDAERKLIDDFAQQHNTANVINIYWEPLTNRTILNATDKDCRQYFIKFRDKYFPQYSDNSTLRRVLYGNNNEIQNCSLLDDFVIIEISTSGDNTECDEIVNLSAVKIEQMVLKDFFEVLIKPEVPLSEEREDLLDITNNMLNGAGSIYNAIKLFHKWNTSKNIVMYHHEYNMHFLCKQTLQDNSLLKENYIIIDAQALMRNMFSKEFSNRLCSFSSAFDLLFGYETSATAENEAKLFAELLRRLKKEYGLKTIKEIEKYWVI